MGASTQHDYIPLSPSDEDRQLLSDGNDFFDEPGSSQTGMPIWSRGWTLFLVACIFSAALSAINLATLSTVRTIHALPTPIRTPSVYMGLDTLRGKNSSLCRSRVTYPESAATFDGDKIRTKTWVLMRNDNMTLRFGGGVSAYLDFRIPDYGLENCTLSLKRNDSSPSSHQGLNFAEVEIWLLSNEGKLTDKVLVDTLRFAKGTEDTTPPFFCPAQSHVFFQLRCLVEDCQIQIPLQNVTAMTARLDSRLQTSFSLTQYEALSCI
ncbi:hypothetical protein OBBRIDRAFT_733742 [Obba rivulosa]|uniref:Ubiquitin 3 binding protein But2 C-terminal domain-containing protein n=1 Tax=Obba rivulosa TaxID=1052685 RepID=A0A8E2AQJ2_9APHY|nr:hypothetical protein OBBRIDRAFT_733742 [Obba rivulosa]